MLLIRVSAFDPSYSPGTFSVLKRCRLIRFLKIWFIVRLSKVQLFLQLGFLVISRVDRQSSIYHLLAFKNRDEFIWIHILTATF